VPDELERAVVSNDFPVFTPHPDRLIPEYLGWFSKTERFVELCRAASEGTTNRVRLKEDRFLASPIPLPPLEEQRRLVARIDILAKRIGEASKLNGQAIAEWPVVLANERNSLFAELAAEIDAVPLGAVADSRLGKMLSSASKTGSCSAPYLRNANIQLDDFDLSSIYEMDFHPNERPTYRLEPGDVLINEGGFGVGRCAVWDGRFDPCYFQKSLHRVRVDPSRILPRFLLHHLIWANEQGHFADITMATTFQHLTGVRLKRYGVLIPPLDRQREIVDHLDRLRRLTKQVVAEKDQVSKLLAALLPSFLDRAFRGEL
jgi:type I restriction enzyme S subunit